MNGALGLFLGIVIGLGLAFLREALDRRVRGDQDLDTLIGLPLLGRLAAPPKGVDASQLAMISRLTTGRRSRSVSSARTSSSPTLISTLERSWSPALRTKTERRRQSQTLPSLWRAQVVEWPSSTSI